jgi:hypothetical protein
MHRMQSAGDRFFCRACGYETRYLKTGFFSGKGLVFDNIRAWNLWQEEKISTLCDDAGDRVIFTDSGMELYSVASGRGTKKLASGELRLYRDRMELPGGASLPVSKISGMSLRGQKDLFIGCGEEHYLLKTPLVRCTVKYLIACIHLGSPVEFGV